jgi:outer membrane protein assembly factor BamB
MPGQYSFTSPPTATGNFAYTAGAGSGGTVYAVSEHSGKVAWTGCVQNGDNSSPAVSYPSGMYVSNVCGQTYDFEPFGDFQLWHPC